MMERPDYSRSIISDDKDRLQITIPVKKNWLLLIMLSIFLLFCAFLILICLWGLTESLPDRKTLPLFLLIPIALLSIVSFVIFKTLVSKWQGVETIIVQNGQLILQRNTLTAPLEIYNLPDVKDLEVYDDADDFKWGDRNAALKPNNMIRFEYGHEIIKFAEDISYAEAEYLLALITEGF